MHNYIPVSGGGGGGGGSVYLHKVELSLYIAGVGQSYGYLYLTTSDSEQFTLKTLAEWLYAKGFSSNLLEKKLPFDEMLIYPNNIKGQMYCKDTTHIRQYFGRAYALNGDNAPRITVDYAEIVLASGPTATSTFSSSTYTPDGITDSVYPL